MGQPELEAALRRDGDNKARDIWGRVEKEAQRLRTEQQADLQRLQHATEAERETQISTLDRGQLAEAEQRAQRCRLDAEENLANRLRGLSETQLERMAADGGAELFHGLAEEIPDHHWQRVLVNQRDLQRAKKRYPHAEIEVTEDIVGGLIVQVEDGRIQIENTLRKRLQHIWP